MVSCCSLFSDIWYISTVAECAIKNNFQVCWGRSVLKLFAAPRDVQLSVGFSFSDVTYVCLCLFWVGTQVVSSIVFANVMCG